MAKIGIPFTHGHIAYLVGKARIEWRPKLGRWRCTLEYESRWGLLPTRRVQISGSSPRMAWEAAMRGIMFREGWDVPGARYHP